MSKTNKTGSWKRLSFALLGRANGRRLLASLVSKKTAHQPLFTFPLDGSAVKRAVFILPPDRLQVVYQLKNVAALKSFFPNAEVTLIAESCSAELASLITGTAVVTYPQEKKRLFSAAFSGFNRSFSGAADVCCLLTSTDDLPLLYLAGRTAAPIRIGYKGAGEYPFVNIHVNPSPHRTYIADRNLAMAEMVGADGNAAVRGVVTKQTEAEIDHMLKEVHCGGPSRPAGIDALFLYRTLGVSQATACVRALETVLKQNIYLFAEKTADAAEMQWLLHFNLPLLYDLTVARTAGLLTRSSLVVTGNTVLFGLAALLAAKAVGIFNKRDIDTYCPATPVVRCMALDLVSDTDTVKGIMEAVAGLVAEIPKTVAG